MPGASAGNIEPYWLVTNVEVLVPSVRVLWVRAVENVQAGIGTCAVVGLVRVGVGVRGICGRRAGVVIPELDLGGVAVGIQGLGGFLQDGHGLAGLVFEGGDGGAQIGIAGRILHPGVVVVYLGGWAGHLLLVVGSDQAEVELAGVGLEVPDFLALAAGVGDDRGCAGRRACDGVRDFGGAARFYEIAILNIALENASGVTAVAVGPAEVAAEGHVDLGEVAG